MIIEIGHFALILALAVACVQSGAVIWASLMRDEAARSLSSSAAVVQFALLSFAFGVLMWAYIVSDFSVYNVAANSHSAKPLMYKISGVWGNHEGSMLLWVLILAAFGAAVALFGNNLPARMKANVLAVQGSLGVAFLAFITLTSNPFIRQIPAPLEGNGLNPILQDVGLAIHPPLLYAGYVGLSIAYSFAVAALLEGQIGTAWARWVRPWTLAAWMFLTLGIATGSWWAYYELGWGGWWFWDPVENASFVPWLAATALLHSAIVMEKREALKAWTIFLAIFAFTLSITGTFIVRSGVLTSVHAFAVDPARGVFVLAIICLFGFGALLLFALRAPQFQRGGVFGLVSRETSLLFNNLVLSVASLTILAGTLFPMVLDALYGEKISVGAPFFNIVFAWLIVPVLIAVPFGPMLSWKRGNLPEVGWLLMWPARVALLAMLVVTLNTANGAIVLPMVLFLGSWVVLEIAALFVARELRGWVQVGLLATVGWLAIYALIEQGPVLAAFGIGLGVWLIAGALSELAYRAKAFAASWSEVARRFFNLPRSNFGTTLAHIGLGLTVLGITATSAWRMEHVAVMKEQETIEFAGFGLKFEKSGMLSGPNYEEEAVVFTLSGPSKAGAPGEPITTLMSSKRRFTSPPNVTTETAIYRAWSGDFYVAAGEIGEDGKSTTVRLYFNPLVRFIWIGALVMVAGGLFSLADRRLRVGAPVRNRARSGGDAGTTNAAEQTA